RFLTAEHIPHMSVSVSIVSVSDCCCLLSLQHNKAAVQVKEDMKKMVQMPILRPRIVAAKHTKVFGASLFALRDQGLLEDGVPLVVRRMVEHLRKHALHQEGLFRVNGNVRAVETLKQHLEGSGDVNLLSESDSCTVASLLKQYLRDLPGGLVVVTVQQALIQHYQDVRHLLLQLPDVHYSLLHYLCHFLTLVENNHKDNRMTALNLATVFGPSVFHVAPGFEALKDQNICNKIMAKLIQNYNNIFETNTDGEDYAKEEASPIIVRKGKSDGMTQVVPQPSLSSRAPYHARRFSIPIVLPLTSELRTPSAEAMETTPMSSQATSDTASHVDPQDVSLSESMKGLSSFLDRTIRSAVEQHLFDVNPLEDQHSDTHESTPCPSRVTPTARQRRRHQREQQHQEESQKHREKNRYRGRGIIMKSVFTGSLLLLSTRFFSLMVVQTLKTMKIQESLVTCDAGRVGGEVRGPDSDCEKTSCEDVPRLDLTALTEDNNWGEPTPAYSLQRESMDREEARLSPHCGGRLIRQLLEESSDPMVSPRFYAYGHSQQYLDDTEVPPSPPNAHSFISRRRSSSLGSCDDEREELTSAQLTKRIHVLKKKIHRFEEKFEEERKYRPSHSDKAGNPEVLRWMNELARLRKELKEHKLMKSEEDLTPQPRQRSNTLPKSFGSQLEKKPQQEKASKPPVESTLEGIQKKLQEKRDEVNRPEDIKDMTREQIAAEKVALQKALLYYESIHGRPMTKSERQIMKPLYDRYRLVKQILCRASTIPVIGSPSSKRRGPLLQPIIEGETALFFDDIKEEEDGSEDDGDSKTQFTVTVRPDIGVFSFLEHADEEVDGFISPVDDLSPSKNTMDTRLSNLHSATMQELVEQLQETREEKKRIRKNLKEFEDQFFRQNGRNVQKEDRSPLAVEYNEYKHVKAKLRLLEVLISKRDSTKFI
uniref:Family with sequence similarity 13 member A n=1 Tax=Oreochromis niloticus TaxID=8128 RepID=A0A669DFK0_ORENI